LGAPHSCGEVASAHATYNMYMRGLGCAFRRVQTFSVLMLPIITLLCGTTLPRACRHAVYARRCPPPLLAANNFTSASLAAELDRRGLRSALDDLAEDGPSAFRNPSKVVEYVMLSLQHDADNGIAEAFRFTTRPPGTTSFASGLPLSSKRSSWRRSRFIGGYVSGRFVELDAFAAEIHEQYAWLLGCATWDFAVRHPSTFEPLSRSAEDDFVVEFLLEVDGRPVAVQLFYDWGCWYV
jgi:hypothetical protein